MSILERFGFVTHARHALSTLYWGMRNPRHVIQELAILKDFRSFRRSARGVLDGEQPAQVGRGHVLVVSLSGSIYSSKLEGMLAKALQLRGYEPVVLLRRGAYWARRYFETYGVKRFLYLEDFEPTREEEERCAELCTDFMDEPVDLPTIKRWTFEGADVGQYAISTVARQLRTGMPDLNEKHVLVLLREQLLKSLRGVFIAKHLFDLVKVTVCLFNEVNYSDYGPVYAVARQRRMNIIQFVHGLRDSALIFKRLVPETHRIHPNSLSRSSMERIADKPWMERHEHMLDEEFAQRYHGKWFLSRRDQRGKFMRSRGEIFEELGLDSTKKVAVVFSHVLWDANLFYGHDLFDDNEHWFIETVRAACRNDKVNWLIRLHPAIIWKREWERDSSELNEIASIRRNIGELPSHVHLLPPDNAINSFSIFQIADFGVTIRGTVGMELPCFGIPVLTAGTGRYSGLGFTIDSSDRDEYIARLASIQDIPRLSDDKVVFAKKHALAVFCLRPWAMQAFANVFDENIRGYHPLNPNLYLRARGRHELQASPDLVAFAEWAGDTGRLDYMEPWPESTEVRSQPVITGVAAK